MGRALPLEDAIAETLALADSLATGVAALADEVATVHLLSPREREVALLVAAGKTNRQIASELGMANRTVDTHVRNLLRKLKLSSRTDVAAWSVSNGLLTDDASSD
jgi:DNA-binding NarL/FixJ family response regulator